MTMREFYIYYDQHMQAKNDEFKVYEVFAARVLCMLANINRDKKLKPTPFKEKDFLTIGVEEEEEEQKQTPEQMAMILRMFTLANGGEVNA